MRHKKYKGKISYPKKQDKTKSKTRWIINNYMVVQNLESYSKEHTIIIKSHNMYMIHHLSQ
jgi:hypothetical protein